MTITKKTGAGMAGFAVAALIAMGQPMAAEKFSGMIANKVMAPIVTKFDDGHSIMKVGNEGIIITDDPKHPQNGFKSACTGLFHVATDGKTAEGRGSCNYNDKDGDVAWLSWKGTFAGGTWSYDGGTGKFATLVGSGTYTSVANEGGVGVTRFEGSYEIK